MATTRKRAAADDAPAAQSSDAGGSGGAGAGDNVWLAGLGALAQAQAQGTKAFDALVREGLAQQAKAREAAEAEMTKAAERLGAMTMGGANPWDRLGGIFEGRVQQALQRLGVPSPELLAAMAERIQSLEARLAELENRGGAAPGPEATPRGQARTTGK